MAFGKTAAGDSQTRPEKLTRLACSGNPTIRRLVAQNPSTPTAALRKLATDRDTEVVLAVASNQLTPAAVLEELSHSGSGGVREAVAANPAAPASVLAEIVKARSASDREMLAVAGNPSASAVTLSELRMAHYFRSSDVEAQVLVAIASNPSASQDTLRRLFRRDEKSPAQKAVNRAIAGNPATPFDARVDLFGMDAHRDVVLASEPVTASASRIAWARAASSREAELLAYSRDSEVRRAVVLAPGATDAILEALSNDSIPEVALVAHARSATDQRQLKMLAASADVMVLEALVRNPALSPELKVMTARASLLSAGEGTLEIIANDPTMPSDILRDVVTRAADAAQWAAGRLKHAVALNPGVSAEILRILAMDENAAVRALAARSSVTPLEGLVRLAADADRTVREAVAKNSVTPTELLLRLADDEAPSVVEATASHPNVTATVLDRIVKDQLERRKQLPRGSQFNHDLPEFPLGALAAVAANPRTNQDALRALADSVDQALAPTSQLFRDETVISREVQVWVGIAANESAPPDLLDKVAHAVHKEVWTKTRPDRGSQELERIRESTLREIVNNPSTSIETLEFLSSGDWVARRTATAREREDGHTFTWTVWDDSATDAAGEDIARSVRKEISRRRWNDKSSGRSRLAFASDPDTSPEILEELSIDSDPAVRRAVAVNPATEPKTFERLVGDPAVAVRLAAAAATHPDSSGSNQDPYWYSMDSWGSLDSRESLYAAAFDQLAGDEEEDVRAATAANLDVFWVVLSQPTRDQLAFDDNHRVRTALLGAIARRPNMFDDDFGLSPDALIHLIDTSGPEVWRSLAEKGRLELPVAVLTRLADTGATETVVSVVNAHHVDLPLLVRLAASHDPKVVQAVACKHYFQDDDWAVNEALVVALLNNPLTPSTYLQWVAGKQFRKRRVEAAISAHRSRSESSPASWPSESFHGRVEEAAKEERAIRKQVRRDNRFLVLALAHPNFPEASLIDYAAGTDVRLIQAAVDTGSARAAVAAASNAASPPEILEQLVGNAEPDVRQALLSNKATPPDALVRLIRAGEA